MKINDKYNLLFLSIPAIFLLLVPFEIITNIIEFFLIAFVWFLCVGIYLYTIKCPVCGVCINGSKTFLKHIVKPTKMLVPNYCVSCGYEISNKTK